MEPQVRHLGTVRLPEDVVHKPLRHPNSNDIMDSEQTTMTRRVPWWRRPSPWWLLSAIPFTSSVAVAKLAPRVAIYTALACAVHKPEVIGQGDSASILPILPTPAHFYGYTTFASGVPNPTECASDPVVQAAVAKLIATVAACTGVLSFLTTGFWGAYSDRHGRGRVMGISILGLLLDDLNFILVATFPRLVPGGYWFFVVGAIIEGCLGGYTTGAAAVHTYLTDTTDEHDRSRILSLNIGFLCVGMAVGPTLGSILIRSTAQPISVFYAAVICTLLYSFLVWVILPEAITEEQMAQARAKYNGDIRAATEGERSFTAALLHKFRWVTSSLSPLTIFLPGLKSSSNVANQDRKDWSLTLLALAFGCTISIIGSLQNKLQYAASEFGWSTEMIGYWLSLIGASKAIVMVLILPVAIKFFKQQKPSTRMLAVPSPSEATPFLSPLEDDCHSSSSNRGASNRRTTIDSASFDLGLAKISLIVDAITFFTMAVSRTGWQFTVSTVLGAFGLGFNPAMQSLTLALYTRRGGVETGRLFGALSVVQAFSSQIMGPAIYSFVYARTVATFPRAIFFVTVAAVILSLIFLLLVRLPDKEYQTEILSDTERDGSGTCE